MKKLLLLLATTSCCYLQANAGFYTSLSTTAMRVHNLKYGSIVDDFTISIGYDVCMSNNCYIAFESSIPTILLERLLERLMPDKNYMFKHYLLHLQLGYKIKNNLVLFCSIGSGQSRQLASYSFEAIGVKYFDKTKPFTYRAMLEFRNYGCCSGQEIGIMLGVDYKF